MSLIVAGPAHSYRRWTVAGQVETKLDAQEAKPAWSVPTHHGCARCPSHGLPEMRVELVGSLRRWKGPCLQTTPDAIPVEYHTGWVC
jgi:hypothetical protein